MNIDKVSDAGHEVKCDIKEAAGITSDKDRDPGGKAEKGLRPSPPKDEDIMEDVLNMPKE